MKKKYIPLFLSALLLSCVTLSSCVISTPPYDKKSPAHWYLNDKGELILIYADNEEENVGIPKIDKVFEEDYDEPQSDMENQPSSPCKHVYGAWNTLLPSTCQKRGLSSHTCTLCNDVDYKLTAYLGHTYDIKSVNVDVPETYLAELCCLDCGNTILEERTQNTHAFKNVFYPQGESQVNPSPQQIMDVHLPNDLKQDEKAPVVITLHGGSWCSQSKTVYNYITDFLTNECGCAHININYRLTSGYPTEDNLITYLDMLDDIQSTISCLASNANYFQIDASRFAIMGHSAGAHLAMLYAYKYPRQVDLLIAEAAPTKFVDENMEVLHVDPAICAMTGIPYRGEGYVYAPNDKNNPNTNRDFNEITALRNASPLWIAHDYITAQKAKSSSQQAPLPYSVFAYGGMDLNQDGIIDPNATDGVIPVSHLTDLTAFLDKNSYQSFLFPNVFHSHFGIGDASNSIFVNPNTTNPMIRSYYYGKYDGEELTIPGLKQIIQEKLFN